MAWFTIAINKSISWRGNSTGLTNLYRYDDFGGLAPVNYAAAINAVRNAERPLYADNVTFRDGRLWGPFVDPQNEGQMQEHVKWSNIFGTAGLPQVQWYKEFAFMVYWPLGRYGSKNRPQYLRKWHRTQFAHGISGNAQDGSTALPGAITAFTTYMAAVVSLAVPGDASSPYDLGSPLFGGRKPVGPGQLYPYLEHRQLNV